MTHTETQTTNQTIVPAILQWTGLLAVLVIATLRIVTAFADAVVFDVDPALDPTRFAGLGPAGTLWLDVLLFSGAGLFFLGLWLQRRAADWIMIALAIAPAVVVFLHGRSDLGDLRKGTVWVAGAVAAAVVAHARRHAGMRIVLIMALAGISAPLVVRGATNITYEYDDTLALYQQQKELILADKGWDENSSSALIYERRLQHRQPTGWFTTTNIFGSFMAASLILWLGLGFAAVRARLPGGWPGLCAIFAVICAAGLYLTDSMGALLACAAGVGLLAVLCISTLARTTLLSRTQRAGPKIAILLVIGAIFGIVVHGVLLGSTGAANVSLLFRWHYIISATRIFLNHPWLGAGPDEFQAEYMIERVAMNPEEVASAHSMFFDWFATLGVLAFAWIILAIYLLWRAAAAKSRENIKQQSNGRRAIAPAGAIGAMLGVAVFGVAAAILWERQILDILSWTMRVIGVLGFIAAAAVAGHIAVRAQTRLIDITLLCAAVALVVHGQLEMTWTQTGSVVMAFVFLGAAASAKDRSPRSTALIACIILFAFSIRLGVAGAIPAARLEMQSVRAATELWPVARARQAQLAFERADQNGNASAAIIYRAQRDDALRAIGINPSAGDLDWKTIEQLLKPVLIERRQRAGDILLEAYDDWPVTEDPLAAASKQIGLASQEMQMPQRVPVLVRSMELAEQSARRHRDVASASNAMLMRMKMYELTGEPQHVERAIETAEYLTTQDPLGIRAWVTLGNVLWNDEQFERAADPYRKAIEHSDNFKLDELKQLPAEQRERLESRIAEAETKES